MKHTRGFVVAMAVTTLLTGVPEAQARDTVPTDAEAPVVYTGGTTVRCGDTITEHTKLTRDLYCPSSAPFALQLDGPGIVLDLGGYTVRRTGPVNFTSQGIVVANGRMVRNGTVQGFASGITTTSGETSLNLRLHALAILDNGIGVYNRASNANFLITDSRLSGSAVGLRGEFDASTGNFDVRSSIFTHNELAMIADYHDIDVLDSTFTSNESVFFCWEGLIRIRSSTIAWNDAVGTAHNDGEGPRRCYETRFENTLIANNAAFAPPGEPVWSPLDLSMLDTLVVSNGTGLQAAAVNVYIDGNTFHDNASGLTLSDRAGPSGGTLTGIVRGNQFLSNDGDGLRVVPPSTPTVLDNVALGNAGFGIYAPTAFDGGGNVARDNTAGDCVGIICSPF
ncbi:right-handed parallel beta-helix repeat-containing protein [Corallococcus exiguus]|uniref:right-handed parallel beta-helix repeat-containing protein n=1 Tax=Corallococcus TaxID=83461 RepID=UPI000EE88095|nr:MULTISPECIES: right-handed parallel beta-helix repeat-containing protein [Corallococcus]NPC69658.1 right-handed parallel beta-helix repeat-containing protein [Corallococcus exiguus]RKI01760.1 right-handed parallel beta-helix repeat-containing protein [Corallococcus sp. AB038B]